MANACRSTACAITTISARWALPSTLARWSDNLRFSKKWATTPSAPATIRPLRNCSTLPTVSVSWLWTNPLIAGFGAKPEMITISCSPTGTKKICARWFGVTGTIPAWFSGGSAAKFLSKARPPATKSPPNSLLSFIPKIPCDPDPPAGAPPPDWEFPGQDQFPYVAGEFVWTGFDYLGEPTPYNSDSSNLLNFTDPAEKARMAKELDEIGKIRVPSRSSYFGIIDLAGFKKDRFYIYQARWRPDFPMAHILPHWNWPERVGQVTPVHVYTSGDEAELFLNGKSLGKKKKGQYEYRLHWDDVTYQPGELRVVAYKNGKKWATDAMK